MRIFSFLFFVLITQLSYGQLSISKSTTSDSRKSCVKVISKQGNSSGTGFFVANDVVATCFHVIAHISLDSLKNINFNVFQDLQIVTEDGDTVSVTCISYPSNQFPEPLFQDFALLRTNKIVTNKDILRLSSDTSQSVGDPILFSGYPLGTPTMVTHFGTISGITKDKSIICIEAPTNKGNSGGALIDKTGAVIGIVSMREGGISVGLQNYLNQISQTEKMGSVQLMGIDPLQATKETIRVLDTYISTGIGYARSIKYLANYMIRHKIK
jgi:V8-like Glu-specific endopeptidase